MNSLRSTYRVKTSVGSKKRKRKSSIVVSNGIHSFDDALRLEAETCGSTSDEPDIGNNGKEQFTKTTNGSEANQISTTFVETSTKVGRISSDEHRMKQVVEHSDKEMSVKEALAMGFRNYKVRLPKKKHCDTDAPIDASVLYSLFASDNIDENQKSAESSYSHSTVNKFQAQHYYSNNTVHNSNQHQSSDGNISEVDVGLVKNEPGDLLFVTNGIKGEPVDSSAALQNNTDAKACAHLLPPFWNLPIVVSKGYRGGYYVRGLKYVQLTTLIHHGALVVPLYIPIRFEYSGQIVRFTFNDILLANGVVINDPKNCVELSKVFTASVLLVHHSIAEHLLCKCGPNPLNPNATLKLDYAALPLSFELPPIACHKPEYFLLALNGSYGPNQLFHHCKPNVETTSTVPDAPTGNHDVKQPIAKEVLSSVVSQRENIALTARQKGLVVTHFDTGASIDELSLKFGVPREAIEFIILNRAEVIREQTTALMAETDADEDRERIINGSRKKSRVRRTSFVGLNILMWRFFKDCRDNGIVLNGKLLKEHAMMIARQLGLENFKGSEGWLDAFKRRHRIDLKVMSGVPVNYEETEDEKMEGFHEEEKNKERNNSEPTADGELISQIHSASGGTTAALLECVEKATAPVAVASISNTKPLDLLNILGYDKTLNAEDVSDVITSSEDVTSSLVTPSERIFSHCQHSPMPSDEKGFIAAVVKSAAIRVHDKELSSALETVRSYILSNDASAMPLFVQLQVKLAAVSNELDNLEGFNTVVQQQKQH